MKNAVGVLLRVFASILFLIGIVTCIFSIPKGITMGIVGIIGWNLGARLLDSNATIEKQERNNYMNDKNVKPKDTMFQSIDYSKIPYNLQYGWKSEENRYRALLDIAYMNEFLTEARKIGNIREHLEICTEEVLWDGQCVSELIKIPHTKTGKVPKYIVDFRFATRDCDAYEPSDNYFGDIYYMQDGTIGKAEIVCWEGKEMCKVFIGLQGTTLRIKKIQMLCGVGVNRTLKTIYKS